MGKHTTLYEQHCQAGGKIVDFAGWDLPIHYGSQLQEHHFVREIAGVFDVSHMTVIDLKGSGTCDFLRYLLANDVAKLTPSKALYSCMLNEDGGIIDDLIVYYVNENLGHYRVVVNAATRDKDVAWIEKQSQAFDVSMTEYHAKAMLAVQGPAAISYLNKAFPELEKAVSQLARFQSCQVGDWFIGRTGYTGEEGVEIILPEKEAAHCWQQLLQAGVKPCGLGARDTLRLEAGMHLYGTDMDETLTPLESGLTWTVDLKSMDRDFIGKQALLDQKAKGIKTRFIGLVLETKGVLRNHQRVVCEGFDDGETTSGTFSPSLNGAIALARIPKAMKDDTCHVDMRGRLLPVRIVSLPFVRQGKPVCTA